MLDKYFKPIIFTGIFLIPFIPFIITPTFFPFITGKTFTFRIIVEIIFALWLLLALYDTRYRPNKSVILYSVLLFISVIAVADIFGINPQKSIWSNFERMEGLMTLIHLGMYFVVAGTILNTQRLWTVFLNTTVAASAIMGLYGLSQLSGKISISQGGVRLDGTLGNAIYLAIYMLFHIFITLFLLVRWRGQSFVRYIYSGIMLLQIYILYHTATRGAILGFLFGISLIGILFLILERKSAALRNVGIILVVGIVVLAGGFFFVKDTKFVEESSTLSRLKSISLESASAQTRLTIWGMALEGFKERPILGWGQENFNVVFNKYYKPSLHGQEPWFDRVHNTYLDWLIAGGLLGLVAYLLIPLSTLYCLWFRPSDQFLSSDRVILTGLIVAYGIHSIFEFDVLASYMLSFSMLAYVYAMTRPHEPDSYLWKKDIDKGVLERIVTPLVLIMLVFSVYFINVKNIRASSSLISALATFQQASGSPQNAPEMFRSEKYSESLSLFKKAIRQGSIGTQEGREHFAQNTTVLARQNADQTIKQAFFTSAAEEVEKQIEKTPGDARQYMFLATLLEVYGNLEGAQKQYEQALELSPDKQMIYFSIGSNLIKQGKTQEALKWFKNAVELDENYGRAHKIYATAAVLAGDIQLADKILINEFGDVYIDDDILLQTYFGAGLYDRAVVILQRRIESRPDNMENWRNLGAIYIDIGETGKAINIYQEIVGRFPEHAQDAQEIIGILKSGRRP